jgi:GH25 family lysozyme M1 (1,4-beta-N-acetylmuramidase)
MGTVSGLDASKLSLWADFSHWNSDIDLTKTQPWLDGIFTKLSDGKQMYPGSGLDLGNYKDKTADTNIDKAYRVGIPCIPYHYMHFALDAGWKLDTIVDWQYRVITNALKNKIPGKSFHGFALDIEETAGGNTNARWITEQLYNRLTEAPELGGVPIIFYTSMSILNKLPALRDWLSYQGANRNLWLAQWAFSGRVKTSWEGLYENYISKMNMKFTTPGFADWRFGQWSACFELPGCTVNYTDLNFYHGTKEQAYAWLGYKQTAPPVEPPPVVEPEPPVSTITRAEFDAALARVAELERWRKS